LAQEPPREYLLDEGDILGVYIEGILPYTAPDKPPEPPPVNFPDAESQLNPSLGFPVAVINDGTIQLPLLEPIKVRGLTIEQARELVRKYYLDSKILKDSSRLRPIVTLVKERTYNIVVVRQDLGSGGGQNAGTMGGRVGGFTRGADQSASGRMIKLRAYQNDVLNALMASGGLPGVNARAEVKILRASRADQRRRDEFVQQFYQQYYSNPDPCGCPPPLPDDPSIIKIPLRLAPGVIPNFRSEDIVLEDGDIVYIESREADVFYTGGLLPGGEYLLPRDYDLDVLGAMALSGKGVSAGQNGGGGGLGGGIIFQSLLVPPGMLYILRKTPCNGQITIEVDLALANNDPSQRPLVMPGDTLILRYKPCEEILNFGVGVFFTYGIQYALRGGNGGR
jgi:protein involved in polysaccharide export with SLBB domain